MEQKLVRVPFSIEMAKKITDKSVEGRIVTRDGRNARIVCFDAHCDDNIIALIEDEKGVEFPMSYVSDGMTFLTGECALDLMLEIPEHLTFKDGDILSSGTGFVFILDGNGKHKTSLYACTDKTVNVKFGGAACSDDIDRYTFATEAEKQKLIDALKASKEPKAKEYLKRFFGIEEKPKCEFKFRDVVLVRSSDRDKWCAAEFSNKDGKWYAVFGGLYYEQCIPYNEKTVHLLGTTEDCKILF